jgi:hypothetical protein
LLIDKSQNFIFPKGASQLNTNGLGNLLLLFTRGFKIPLLKNFDFFLFDCFAARLDGVSTTAMKKLSDHKSIEDWLELEQDSNPLDNKGKRRVIQFSINSTCTVTVRLPY